METDKLISLIDFFEKRAQNISSIKIPHEWMIFYYNLCNLLTFNPLASDFIGWLDLNKNNLKGFDRLEFYFMDFNTPPNERQMGAIYSTRRDKDTRILYLESFNPEYYHKNRFVSNEGILLPFGKIPLLKFMDVSKNNKTVSDDPKLAHYDFIIVSLKEMYRNITNEEVKEFIKSNLDKINKIKRSFTMVPQKLGEGADGVAFKVGDNLVFKVFKDAYAYKHALNVLNKLHKNPKNPKNNKDIKPEQSEIAKLEIPELYKTEAMIYDAGVLGEVDSSPIYYYLIEMMNSLNQSTKDSLGHIISFIARKIEGNRNIEELFEIISDSSKNDIIKNTIKMESEFLKYEIEQNYDHLIDNIEDDNNGKLNSSWLRLLIEEIIVKFLSGRTDIHMGNIGLTNYGEFRYFDPAYAGPNVLNI